MLGEILFTIAMVIYWLSEGCTEGYTWANKTKRKNNKLIFGAIHNGKKDGVGYLDYHAWRLGENIGMVGSIFSAFLFSNKSFTYAFAAKPFFFSSRLRVLLSQVSTP